MIRRRRIRRRSWRSRRWRKRRRRRQRLRWRRMRRRRKMFRIGYGKEQDELSHLINSRVFLNIPYQKVCKYQG